MLASFFPRSLRQKRHGDCGMEQGAALYANVSHAHCEKPDQLRSAYSCVHHPQRLPASIIQKRLPRSHLRRRRQSRSLQNHAAGFHAHLRKATQNGTAADTNEPTNQENDYRFLISYRKKNYRAVRYRIRPPAFPPFPQTEGTDGRPFSIVSLQSGGGFYSAIL